MKLNVENQIFIESGNNATDFKFIEWWCGRSDLNRQAIVMAQDFKSCVFTNFTTPARHIDIVCQCFVTLLLFGCIYKYALLETLDFTLETLNVLDVLLVLPSQGITGFRHGVQATNKDTL